MQIRTVSHQQSCHNSCDGMWCVILCIFTTSGCVVVLYQILKYAGEKVIILLEGFFKRKVYQFIDLCTRKGCSLRTVSNKWCQRFKQRYFCISRCLCREYISILFCYIRHCIVKNCVEISLSLLIP